MAKIVAIMGSPHMSGNGVSALDTILSGAAESGAECIRYNLCKLTVKNCIGCRKCVDNGGVCVLQDDMKEIFENIKTADTVIIESPIYINQINGYVKNFLDRCFPLTDEKHKPRFGKRNLTMLYTYGVPFPLLFSRYIRNTGKSLKAMGLIYNRRIAIHGCTTQDKVEHDKPLKVKLKKFGKQIGKENRNG